MRDLEWLKGEIQEKLLKSELFGVDFTACKEFKDEILGLIDQIEQPEITTEQALNKLAEKYPFSSASIGAILEGHAQQGRYEQPELPVIPDFVAEEIELMQKANYPLRKAFDSLHGADFSRYMRDNEKDFAIAYLFGYTVEEKKYYARSRLSSLPNFKNSGEHFFSTFPNTTSKDIWLTTKNNAVALTEREWAKLYVNENNALFIEKNVAVEDLIE